MPHHVKRLTNKSEPLVRALNLTSKRAISSTLRDFHSQVKSIVSLLDSSVIAGILGRVKAILKALPNTFILDRSLPTSKYCFDCFHKNEDLKVWEREFICPSCGVITDRDVHAAQNMIAFYKLIQMVPMECRDPKRIKETLIDIKKRVEINPSRSLEEAIQLVIQGLSMKHEATDALASW